LWAGFFACPGISLTDTVEELLEWLGVEVTEECSELAFLIRLGIRRPGILALDYIVDAQLEDVIGLVCSRSSTVVE
jgi:hypothetical protein